MAGVKWANAEDNIVRSYGVQLLDMDYKSIKALLPNRTVNAVRHRVRETFKFRKRPFTRAAKRFKHLNIDPITSASIAGIVDGEGTISMYKTSQGKSVRYVPFMSICNTSIPLIEYMKVRLNMRMCGHDKRGDAGHYGKRKIYLIQTNNILQLKVILIAILPYLIVKRKAAELVMSFIDERASKKYGAPHGVVEASIYEKIRGLKKGAVCCV